MVTGAGVVVRPAGAEEQDQVAAVVRAAFQEERVVDLVAALQASPAYLDGLSLVAVEGDRVVGHVLLTRGLLDADRRLVDVLVLSPLAVAPAVQRRGIGRRLVSAALSAADERSEPLVFLEGSPNYYGRSGFLLAGPLGFRRPSLRIPEEAFQVSTRPSYEPWMRGTLVYADPFWRLDCVGLRDTAAQA